MRNDVSFSVLLGKTLVRVEGLEEGSDGVEFLCDDGSRYSMHHQQDCCEVVSIEEVIGDPADLVGLVVEAEEVSNPDFPAPDKQYVDSYTWTFYKIGTTKGFVTIRWLGESNGYYSERVDFEKIA